MSEDYLEEKRKDVEPKLDTFKKVFMIITLTLLIVFTLLSRQNSNLNSENLARKPVEKLTISLEYNKVSKDKPQRINVKRYPREAIDDTLTWNISDANILEVKGGNTLYGKSKGIAKISLSSANVTSNVLEVESVDFAKDINIENLTNSIPIRTNYKFNVDVLPKTASNPDIYISSTNPEVISIKDADKKIISGEKTGKSNIQFVDSFGDVLKEIPVEVKWEKVTDITIDEPSITIGKNQKYILYAEVEPKNATYTDVKWGSLNPSIASVNDSGIIVAKDIGETYITATADDGRVVKKTKVTVVSENISNDVKYASGNYDILSGASDSYETLGKTETWGKVEILKTMQNGYYKIRTEKGELGFVKNDDGNFLNELPKLITGIPYLNKEDYNLDNAPEMLVGSILLKYIGIQATPNMIKNKFEYGDYIKKTKKGDFKGSNPFKVFVGSPVKKDGSYGSYAEPLKKTLQRIIRYNTEKYIAKNISHSNINVIQSYIDKDQPVIAWSRVDGKNIEDGMRWKNEDGKEFVEKKGKTPVIITGYNDNYIIAADPLTSNNLKIKKLDFIKNYNAIGSQALVIEKIK